jgi:hypothetical protein
MKGEFGATCYMKCCVKKLVFVVLGIVGGGGLALLGSLAVGMLIGLAYQMLNPNDLSAGSAAEIVMLLIPLGLIAGSILGAFAGWKLSVRGQRNG